MARHVVAVLIGVLVTSAGRGETNAAQERPAASRPGRGAPAPEELADRLDRSSPRGIDMSRPSDLNATIADADAALQLLDHLESHPDESLRRRLRAWALRWARMPGRFDCHHPARAAWSVLLALGVFRPGMSLQRLVSIVGPPVERTPRQAHFRPKENPCHVLLGLSVELRGARVVEIQIVR